MKRLVLIINVCVLTISMVYSQPRFLPKRSVADSLRDAGDLNGSIVEFTKALINDPKNKQIVYNYACALSLNKQIDSCFKYLNIAIKLDTTTAALVDPDFLNAREDKQWIDFENQLVSMLVKKNKTPFKDLDYAKALWRMMAYDQSYMYEIGIAVRKLGFTSPVVSALQKLKSLLNERNQKELEALIAKNGWPKNSEVGSKAAEAAFYIIQHSDAEKQQKYIPMLKKCCEEKEANWIHYAMLYDRMKMNQKLPQKYGTQMNLDNRKTGTYEIYQLEDKSKVNEWRKELGLPPLKEIRQ
ncbi:MAG: DUF6624 domain-containing protein [Tenuifilaceae bacterium]